MITVSSVIYIVNVIGVSLKYTAEHRVSAGTRRSGVQLKYEDRERGRTYGLTLRTWIVFLAQSRLRNQIFHMHLSTTRFNWLF